MKNIGFLCKILFGRYINGIAGAADNTVPYSSNADIESLGVCNGNTKCVGIIPIPLVVVQCGVFHLLIIAAFFRSDINIVIIRVINRFPNKIGLGADGLYT